MSCLARRPQPMYPTRMRSLAPGLSSAANTPADLGAGHALGEGQALVVDQHPSQEYHEEDSQDAADEHQARALPVVDVVPDRFSGVGVPRDEESGDRENRSRHDGLSDRRGGSAGVLFEDRSPEDLQNRHGHHRRREGGRDGHPRHEAEVGVCRPKDDGKDGAENERRNREFLHPGFRRHIGLERTIGHLIPPFDTNDMDCRLNPSVKDPTQRTLIFRHGIKLVAIKSRYS